MCGIAGIISCSQINPIELKSMSQALQHRGPDGFGYLLYSPQHGIRLFHNQTLPLNLPPGHTVGLVHRRLSIIDLSLASLQPLVDSSQSYCLIYNGEIYNYRELRTELEGLGFTFQSTGDGEVLLHAYAAWGPDCLSRLNGMWAFALLDIHKRQIFCSRDRFGIKPFYYTFKNGTLYFASEIKGLLAVNQIDPKPQERKVRQYLLTGQQDDSEETFFEEIFNLPAGHFTLVSLDNHALKFSPRPYWTFPENTFEGSEAAATQHFRHLFIDSIRIHMQSDVPVGTCLSGGLDSSSIVCAAETLRRSHQVPHYSHLAFGYCASDPQLNEKRHMEAVVAATTVKMHYIDFGFDQFQENLPHILQAQDEPFGSTSIVAQWFVFQHAAAKGIKVMLDGQGADETLAGYHGYFYNIAAKILAVKNIVKFLSLRSQYQRDMGPFPISLPGAMRLLLNRSLPQLHRLARTLGLASPGKRTDLLRMALNSNLSYRLPPATDSGPGKPGFYSLNQQLQLDVRSLVLPSLLRYEDRNSMAHSLEARVPFLDHRLVEFLFTLPEEWKIKGITTKNILREAMKGILPEFIRTRKDKIGFRSAPALLFSYISRHFDDLMRNETVFEQQWFNPEGLRKILETTDRSTEMEFILWRLINIKLWARQFWGDGKPRL
jgi:asparagine synthase (glutamine-hydrolysing)